MIQRHVGGGTLCIWGSRREIQRDRITGMHRIIQETNRNTGETGMETQEEAPLRGSGQENQPVMGEANSRDNRDMF